MASPGILIEVVSSEPRETARYVLHRLRASWPDTIAFGPDAEPCSIWSSFMPDRFMAISGERDLQLYAMGMEQAVCEISCIVTTTAIQFAGTKPAIKVMEQLAGDPVWGPDWTLATRTHAKLVQVLDLPLRSLQCLTP